MFIFSLDFFSYSVLLSEIPFSYVFDLSASLFYFILLNSLNYYLDKKTVTNVFKYYCSALIQTLFKATFWLLKWNFKYPILIFQDVFPVNEGSRVTSTSMSSAWHLFGSFNFNFSNFTPLWPRTLFIGKYLQLIVCLTNLFISLITNWFITRVIYSVALYFIFVWNVSWIGFSLKILE